MTDFEVLLAELDALEGDPRTKRRVVDLLGRYAGRVLYISHHAVAMEIQQERQALLERLAALRYPRAERVRMISERWGVTRRTAERWVAAHHA